MHTMQIKVKAKFKLNLKLSFNEKETRVYLSKIKRSSKKRKKILKEGKKTRQKESKLRLDRLDLELPFFASMTLFRLYH